MNLVELGLAQNTLHSTFIREFDIVECKEALEKADIVTFLVGHKEFKNLDIKTSLDFCGILNHFEK